MLFDLAKENGLKTRGPIQRMKRWLHFKLSLKQLQQVIQRSFLLLLVWMCMINYIGYNDKSSFDLSNNQLCNHRVQQDEAASYADTISQPSTVVTSKSNDNTDIDFMAINMKTGNQKSPSQKDIIHNSQQFMPYIPFELWWEKSSRIPNNKTDKAHNCAYFPNTLELNFNNKYWQVMTSTNGTFHLYGAYYDDRVTIKKPSIRILGMLDRIKPTLQTSCYLWYDTTSDPIVMPIIEYRYIWDSNWGNYQNGILQPYLMKCHQPDNSTLIAQGFKAGQIPISVSLVEKPCREKVTNNLRISNNLSAKQGKFGVCVKALDFPEQDLSVRLIEWIELLGLLGADKIFFYLFDVHPNVSKVLDHYTQTGKVDVREITLPGNQPNVPGLRHIYLKTKIGSKRQNELIPYNDCLYRNLNNYDYLAVIDIDELIVPKNVKTWKELMDIVEPNWQDNANPNVRASYNFQNVYFWEDRQINNYEATIPRYMHMSQHVYRSYNHIPPDSKIKSFHNVNKVITIHNHFPLSCVGKCTSPVKPEIAHLQHYRADCSSGISKTNCNNRYKKHLVKDTTIWRYKDELISKVVQVLKTLGYFVNMSNP